MSSQPTFSRYATHTVVLLSCLAIAESAKADGVNLDGGLAFRVTDNVFLDKSQQWDFVLHPSAEISADFANIYSAGYSFDLNAYTRHGDLWSHWHQLYFYINPAWGAEGEHEFTVEVSIETLRNQSEYSDNNLVRPLLLARLDMEPERWLRFCLTTKLTYGSFYEDAAASSVDAWAIGEVSFTLTSLTTLSPRLTYGYRYYPKQDLRVTADTRDQQIELGTHLSQALWVNAGLQLDYLYVFTLGQSGLLLRKLTQDQFSYLDQGFLYSGNQAMAGIKQLLGKNWTLDIAARFKEYNFAGWQVLDASGVATGQERRDLRFTPAAGMSYLWSYKQNDEERTSSQVQVSLEYNFTKQWSNSDWYDTFAHAVVASVQGSL